MCYLFTMSSNSKKISRRLIRQLVCLSIYDSNKDTMTNIFDTLIEL